MAKKNPYNVDLRYTSGSGNGTGYTKGADPYNSWGAANSKGLPGAEHWDPKKKVAPPVVKAPQITQKAPPPKPKPTFQPPVLTLGDLKSGSAKATPKPAAATKPAPKPQGPTFTPPKVSVGDVTSGKAKAADVKAKAPTAPPKASPLHTFENALKDVKKFGPSAAKSAGEGLGLAAVRTAVGIPQTASQLADLVTPGKGTNRVTKKLDAAGKFVDETAKADRAAGYTPQQIPLNIGAALVPGDGVIKAAKAIPGGAKVADALDAVRPTKIAGALDKVAGKGALKAIDKVTGKVRGEGEGLPQIGQKGVIGAANNIVSRAGKDAVYKASDLLQKTKAGSSLVNTKNNFMNKFIDSDAAVIRDLKRQGHEKHLGSSLVNEFRLNRGNLARATSEADARLNEDPHFQGLMQGLKEHAAKGDNNIIHSKDSFDDYASARAESDLIKAGKSEYTPAKAAKVEQRLAATKAANPEFEKLYDKLPKIYSGLLKSKYEAGRITKEEFQRLKGEKFDYVRIQRELPDWAKEKPNFARGGSGAGSKAVQKRKKFASSQVLSPTETLIRAYQTETHAQLADKLNRSLVKSLSKEGKATLVRATEDVEHKRELLKNLKDTKPIATKMNKTIRTHAKVLRRLQTRVNQLNKQGMDLSLARDTEGKGRKDAFAYLNKEEVRDPMRTSKRAPTMRSVGTPSPITGTATTRLTTAKGANSRDVRQLMKDLVTADPAELRRVRGMIERGDTKVSGLMDKIELMNHDLHTLQQSRKADWMEANSMHIDPKKSAIPYVQFHDKGVLNVAKVDPHIAAAVNNWHTEYQGLLEKNLRWANNLFKYGTTVGNLAFPMRNGVKDFPFGAVNSPASWATHNAFNTVLSVLKSAGVKTSEKDARLMQEYNRGNKGSLLINQYDKPRSSRQIANEAVTSKGSIKQKIFTYAKNPISGAKLLKEDVDKLIGVAEKSGRFQNFRGTYNKAIKEGYSHQDAVRIAHLNSRDNTIDFSVMGDYVHTLNSLYPYFNAPIQGLRTLGRSVAERPVSTAAKLTAVSAVPEVTLAVWNLSDPKRRAIYATIPEYEKSSHFVIISPGAHFAGGKWQGVYLIPKSQELDAAGAPARSAMEYMMSDPKKAKSLGDWLKKDAAHTALEQTGDVSPIQGNDPKSLALSTIPQILRPTVEGFTNQDFYTGKDIVPSKGYDPMSNLPATEQYYKDHYSDTSLHLGKLFNMSPLQVDHFIKGTFGSLGQQGQNLADNIITRNPQKQGGKSLGSAISGSFKGPAGGADQTSFYKSYAPAKAQHDSISKKITKLLDQGNYQQANRLADQYNATIEGRFKKFRSQYKDSPTYDKAWDDQVTKLKLSKKRIVKASKEYWR